MNRNDVSIGSSVSRSDEARISGRIERTHSLIETGAEAVRRRTEAFKEKRDAEDIDPMVDYPRIR